ncbi:MAG: winged helix-turn-helix domain-containing protein [Pyrinomonadaceae bacterium]
METEKIRYYDFGDFRVDARRRILLKNNETVSLSPRNFDLLLVLVENDGNVLGHDELLDRVWEGTFVEQANLKNAISVIRKILGEDSVEGGFIRTIPRRGYSFVAPVTALPDTVVFEQTESEVVIEEIVEVDDGEPAPGHETLILPSAGQREGARGLWLRVVAGVVAVGILAAVVFGIWQWKAGPSPWMSIDNIKITRLTSKGTLNGAIVSPDGNYFLYATNENDGTTLWVQQIATGSATKLTPKMTASFWFYTFAPDSSYIFYTVTNNPDAKENGLFKIPLFGGSAQRVGENTESFTFSPDGKKIVFARSANGKTSYLTADPDRSNEKVIAEFTEEYRIWSLQWTPDSRGVLFSLRRFVGDKAVHQVREYPADGGEPKVVVPEMDKQITAAAWLPDRRSLIVCLREKDAEIRQLWQFDPSSGELRRITNDDNSYKGFSIPTDGRSIVTITENLLASAWSAADDKYEFRQVTSGAGRIGSIGTTRDGRYVYASTNNGLESVSVVNADGTGVHQLTNGNDGIWLTPRVSADGNSVTFASSRGGRAQLYKTDLDGRNVVQLTRQSSDVFNGKLLADNQTIVFQGIGDDKGTSIFKQAADGTKTVLANDSFGGWDVSPDEKYLAYLVNDDQTQRMKVVVKTLDSGWPYKTFDIQPCGGIRWTRDGSGLTYDSIDGEISRVMLQPMDGGPPRVLTSLTGERIFSFDWGFDGKRLSMIRGKSLNDAVQIKFTN